MKREDVAKTLPRLADICVETDCIDPVLYTEFNVKRGLRDLSGKGVVTGLTDISTIISSKEYNGEQVPCRGELYYRGINVSELVEGFQNDNRFGFEEICYLLIFGKLPNAEQLEEFKNIISAYMSLPPSFVRDIIMKAPSKDMMNTLARSVLALYSYDDNPNDTSVQNVLRQCLQLLAEFPLLAVYGYQTYNYYHGGKSLYIHEARSNLSIAENTLRLLRPNKKYTDTEAKLLDLALVLHAEHGGGNNSTFSCRSVASTGTDTYSAIAAAVGSLKGPKHGGANRAVLNQFEECKRSIRDWKDDEEVAAFVKRILRGEVSDHTGLVYGMGHAIYTLSDPRAVILKHGARRLAQQKGMLDELELMEAIERVTPAAFAEVTGSEKVMCANVDMYSGLVYQMLDIPSDLFTPLFAVARIAGWCAHRMEETLTGGRIYRPAYKSMLRHREYIPFDER